MSVFSIFTSCRSLFFLNVTEFCSFPNQRRILGLFRESLLCKLRCGMRLRSTLHFYCLFLQQKQQKGIFLLVGFINRVLFRRHFVDNELSFISPLKAVLKRTPGTDLSSASSLFFGDEEFPALKYQSIDTVHFSNQWM